MASSIELQLQVQEGLSKLNGTSVYAQATYNLS